MVRGLSQSGPRAILIPATGVSQGHSRSLTTAPTDRAFIQ